MRQFVNSIDILLAECLDGFATAHADIIVLGRESASRNGLVRLCSYSTRVCARGRRG